MPSDPDSLEAEDITYPESSAVRDICHRRMVRLVPINLQRHRRIKADPSIIYSACVCSVLRTVEGVNPAVYDFSCMIPNQHFIWIVSLSNSLLIGGGAVSGMWSLLELNVAIISACLPTLRPLFFPKNQTKSKILIQDTNDTWRDSAIQKHEIQMNKNPWFIITITKHINSKKFKNTREFSKNQAWINHKIKNPLSITTPF